MYHTMIIFMVKEVTYMYNYIILHLYLYSIYYKSISDESTCSEETIDNRLTLTSNYKIIEKLRWETVTSWVFITFQNICIRSATLSLSLRTK